MEISIKKEDLQTKSIFVATPMYGGMNHGLYAKACLDLQALCIQYGVNIKFSFLFNESLITRARNYLVDEFLHRSECTHLLFLDSDIHFDPRDVIALLALDKDVIGGPYPKKAIKWKSVKKAIEKNPDIDPQTLEKVTGDYVFNSKNAKNCYQVTSVEDSSFCQLITTPAFRDSYDITEWGNGVERCIDGITVGDGAYEVKYSSSVWNNVRDVEYSMYVNNCKNCFLPTDHHIQN